MLDAPDVILLQPPFVPRYRSAQTRNLKIKNQNAKFLVSLSDNLNDF